MYPQFKEKMLSPDDHSHFSAAIFDFDGTLVDSMPLHYRAYCQVLGALGINLTEEDFYTNVGGKWTEAIPKFLRGRHCSMTPDEIHAQKKVIVERLLKTEPLPVLDTASLLPLLHNRIKIALASSGARLGIDTALTRLGWTQYFDAIIAGEDVICGKPAPDPFLLAAEKLGISPVECIVFEDTDDGVEAGKRAGMTVIDVRRTAGVTSRLSSNSDCR